MKAWIANKLFDLARWVDFETVQDRCEMATIARDIVMRLRAGLAELEAEPEAAKDDDWKTHVWVPAEEEKPKPKPKPKRGRRKSSVAGARRLAGARLKVSKVAEPKRPRGRPKGSKNKPKAV